MAHEPQADCNKLNLETIFSVKSSQLQKNCEIDIHSNSEGEPSSIRQQLYVVTYLNQIAKVH